MDLTFEELRERMEALMAASARPADDPPKRARILESAMELFVRHGFRKTSVDEVARGAHVSKGTVYLYFASKADLLVQAVMEEKRRYWHILAPVFADGVEAGERLRLYVRQMIGPVHDMPLLAQVMRGDREIQMVLEETDSGLRERAADLGIGFVAGMIREAADAAGPGIDPKLAEERARTLMALLYGSWFLGDERVRPGLTIERYAQVLSDWLVAGVGDGGDG